MLVLTSVFNVNERIRSGLHAFRDRYETKECEHPCVLARLCSRTCVQHVRRRIYARQRRLAARACVRKVQVDRNEDGPTFLMRFFVVERVDLERGARGLAFLGGRNAIRRHKVSRSQRASGKGGIRLANVVSGLRRDRFDLLGRWALHGRVSAKVSYRIRFQGGGGLGPLSVNCCGLFFHLLYVRFTINCFRYEGNDHCFCGAGSRVVYCVWVSVRGWARCLGVCARWEKEFWEGNVGRGGWGARRDVYNCGGSLCVYLQVEVMAVAWLGVGVATCRCLLNCRVGPSMRHVTVVSCLLGRGARPYVSRVCATLYGRVPALSGAAMCGALGLFMRRNTTGVLAVSRGGTYFSKSIRPRTRFRYGIYGGVCSIRVPRGLDRTRPFHGRNFVMRRIRRCCGKIYPRYTRGKLVGGWRLACWCGGWLLGVFSL